FYPLDEEKPCYVPKLEEGKVLSIANLKFGIGPQIDRYIYLF
ncbi:3594_t:CDS:1, partial [Rhizophagus irregularis]